MWRETFFKAGAALECFNRDRRGNFALKFALVLPVLLGLAAGTMDYTALGNQRTALQDASDAAALAAVKEASLKGWNEATAKAVAEAIVRANYSQHFNTDDYYTVDARVDRENRSVTVNVVQDRYPFFAASVMPSPQLSISSTATAAGSANICVIGLDTSRPGTVSLIGNDPSVPARLQAPDCAIYSNSDAIDGLEAIQSSAVTSDLACSAGGYAGMVTNYSKEPLTDCPRIDDPLSTRPAPTFGGCDERGLEIKGKGASGRLRPGVYCDGLTVKSGATVEFEPGIYVIKDGPLTLAANAKATGKGVGFYFTGPHATFNLMSGSSISLEAPTVGTMAGLMFYQDRNASEIDFIIKSNNASVLVGTVYLPNGNLIIDTASKVADQSAYTAIVARSLQLRRSPTVVLNTDYAATDVPVPEGLGTAKGAKAVRLVR